MTEKSACLYFVGVDFVVGEEIHVTSDESARAVFFLWTSFVAQHNPLFSM